MKKPYLILTALLMAMFLTACGASAPQSWDCTVEGKAGAVTYSTTELRTATGTLSFQNRNPFSIVLHLYENGVERAEPVELQSGGSCAWYRLNQDAVYTVGLEAEDGASAVCIAFDGTEQTPYSRKGEQK